MKYLRHWISLAVGGSSRDASGTLRNPKGVSVAGFGADTSEA